MRNLTLPIFLIVLTACATESRNASSTSQFDVMRKDINVDALLIKCAQDPKSAGFDTSEECFDFAGKLLNTRS